ncbi:FAD-binding protein [Archaeoglobus sp.]|uniref:FAD-binding protein n=1 Tax=Archaeoglobus sp. TaxID=1872626 RepID=UPI0024AA4E5E|nr:FAD-binding protein [Archaeoglobus sp.]MDI3497929.1 hypothetical protein [Archaeoglobus sp.]
MQNPPRKVVIAGGSVAGLEAAIRFSEFCRVVVVLEEHEEIGLPVQCAEGWIRFTSIEPYVEGRRIDEVDMVLFNEQYEEDYRFTI